LRLLLDTHALLWWLGGDPRLSKKARDAIDDDKSEIFASAASVWEICTKFRIRKLELSPAIAADIGAAIASQGFLGLPVTVEHAQLAGSLPGKHKDPFDRMLFAQAMTEGMTLVTKERDMVFGAYDVKRLW
jgi:PIN domain nuclease of toxin-antitoxin system